MQNRRTLLLTLAATLGGLDTTLRPGTPAAQPAAARTPLTDAEPAGLAIGYRDNAKNVDTRQYPGYRRGQSCSTCSLVELGTGRQRGCTAVPGRLVLATGWCKLWALRGS
jgi:hypothetical protein